MPLNAALKVVAEMTWPGAPGAVVLARHPDSGRLVGINHACPCGCGSWSFIRLDPESWAPGTVPIWRREDAGGDDLSRATLSPSIGVRPLINGKYHWHGHLRDGIFTED